MLTTVMHGDKDKLVKPSGGRATAKAISGARHVVLPGWGHDLPRDIWPRIHDEIEAAAPRADGAAESLARPI